jgi:hypothetical protein
VQHINCSVNVNHTACASAKRSGDTNVIVQNQLSFKNPVVRWTTCDSSNGLSVESSVGRVANMTGAIQLAGFTKQTFDSSAELAFVYALSTGLNIPQTAVVVESLSDDVRGVSRRRLSTPVTTVGFKATIANYAAEKTYSLLENMNSNTSVARFTQSFKSAMVHLNNTIPDAFGLVGAQIDPLTIACMDDPSW